MAKHLYIIGNGFDLHHGINSSYRDFREWLSENNCDLINRIDEIYGNCDNDWWSDFENQLASLDAIRYGGEIAFENQPDLMSEHCDRTWNDAEIEVEHQLENLYSELREYFHDWIVQLNPPSNLRKINLEIHEAFFINFNYTKTLEDLYGINSSRVLHIHGCVDYNEYFIFGHGKSYDELQRINSNSIKIPEPPENLSSEDLAQFYEDNAGYSQEFHEELATNAAIRGVASQRKPVADLIKKYETYFESIIDVNNIHVYGLSLSEVDLPYLKYFASKFKLAHWEFNDFKAQNINKIKMFCRSHRITNYSVIELNDIMDTQQLTIQFPE